MQRPGTMTNSSNIYLVMNRCMHFIFFPVLICDILAITHAEQSSRKTSDEGVIVLDYIYHVNNDKKILRRETVKFFASLHNCQELTEKVISLVASCKYFQKSFVLSSIIINCIIAGLGYLQFNPLPAKQFWG